MDGIAIAARGARIAKYMQRHPGIGECIGQIGLDARSEFTGYVDKAASDKKILRDVFEKGDAWFRTGDLGYQADGELFICGRAKDLIILNGKNYYPQDIEWAIGELPGVRRGNVFAFSVDVDGQESLVIAAEANRADAAELREQIKRLVSEEFGLVPAHIAIVPLGELPKTSSGKAQRRKTKQLYEAGELPEHTAE